MKNLEDMSVSDLCQLLGDDYHPVMIRAARECLQITKVAEKSGVDVGILRKHYFQICLINKLGDLSDEVTGVGDMLEGIEKAIRHHGR